MPFQTHLAIALLAAAPILAFSDHAHAAGGNMSCGHVSTEAGVVPSSKDIFQAAITQIDGRAPRLHRYQHKLDAGKHILAIGERIDSTRLNSAQLTQIQKMQRSTPSGFFKALILDVQPGINYRLGVRLLRDKLDTQSIRDNAYWEPVVWEEVPQACP
ncbi:hypothetical protein [Pseudoxanthomonas yeongjuensis]|uniref:hypothetical protein n=1 Tax=Pseudoxanthomonas yeongjuensis TaxID=377616 RepID=UPI001391E276|nr:hypothetical protein [Pseudoxanthomonas yeongjuensis]